MNSEAEFLLQLAVAVVLTLIWLAGIVGMLFVVHFLLSLPLRRAERARFFLDLMETALRHGEPVETALVYLSDSHDRTLGERFYSVAARLRAGMRLAESVATVPRFLPPQINAMLAAGQRLGDFSKVLPACRQFLRDALSQTSGAMSYVFILAFVITPGTLIAFSMISIKVLPQVMGVAEGMMITVPASLLLLVENRGLIMLTQFIALAVLWTVAFIYISGPRAGAWIPFLDAFYFRLPWRRKRMQRDFSALLAVLLDAQMPEAEAVQLAAECTANPSFEKRARRVTDRLKQGAKLTDAVATLDDSGEFRWRLTNAAHAHVGFLPALVGWHDALDAKAFQQEQAAAHGITTALVLVNGFFVGTIVVAVFSFLVSIINQGILW